MNLDLLKSAIETCEISSETEFDQDFHTVVSHIEKDEWEEAIPYIESSFEEKKLDIRFITYFFYAYTDQNGLLGFSDVLPILSELLDIQWEKLSPSKKRERHVEKSLHWLFTRQLKRFEGINRAYQKNDLDPLNELIKGASPEIIADISERANHLRRVLIEKWPESQLVNQLMHITKGVRELSQMALKKEEEKPPVFTPKKGAKKDKVVQPPPPPPKEEKPESSSSIPLNALQPSPALEDFYKKIQAFKALVERKDYKKAAVIAEDIENRLENFNPVVYFPKLFVEYYSLYAKFASNIDENRHSGDLRLLQKLFDADLDAFVSW